MKKLLATIAAVLISAATYGQGQVAFENFTIPNAIIYMPDGTTGVGTDGRVQLHLPDGTALGSPVTFEASSPGQFFGGIVTVPGLAVGAQTAFLVRAWIGDSWEASLTRNEQLSSVWTLGGDTTVPTTVEFASFDLQVVPEPSTLVLGADRKSVV